MTTSIDWYGNTKLKAASYKDLPAAMFNHYSILGENNLGSALLHQPQLQ